jgi:hypothetical protein
MLFCNNNIPKKNRLGPQNGPESSGPEKKLLKIVNSQNCQKHVLGPLEKVGGHRYPPGSQREWEERKFNDGKRREALLQALQERKAR